MSFTAFTACKPSSASVTSRPRSSSSSFSSSRFSNASSTTRSSDGGKCQLLDSTCSTVSSEAKTSSGDNIGTSLRSSCGIVTKNVLPSPGTLLTIIFPPIASDSFLEIDKPRPVPPKRRVIETSACVKASKIVACCCSLIPIPVSLTAISMFESRYVIARVTPPSSVNFMALPTRLVMIWRSRAGSETMVSGKSLLICISRPMDFSSALTRRTLMTSWAISAGFVAISSTSIAPDSTLDKSSTSLISSSK